MRTRPEITHGIFRCDFMEMRGPLFPLLGIFHSDFDGLGTAQRGREIPTEPPFGEIGKLSAYHGRSSTNAPRSSYRQDGLINHRTQFVGFALNLPAKMTRSVRSK